MTWPEAKLNTRKTGSQGESCPGSKAPPSHEESCREIGWPGTELCNELARGVGLVGNAVPESEYKLTLDPSVRAVLGAKRLLLAKKVAEEIGWPDTELFSELATGFGLVGRDT